MKTAWSAFTHDTWALEFLSLLCSLLSLAVMVVLLAFYNGKAVFDWHGVTLNAIVSVLSTASKGWLILAVTEVISQWKWVMFSKVKHRLEEFDRIDRASRGPLGCIQTLWKGTGGAFLSMGALIVILAVAVDPFAQQLIQLKTKFEYRESSAAWAPAAKRYSKGFDYMDSGSWTFNNITYNNTKSTSSDFSMQSAFLFGLSNPLSTVTQQLEVGCPSGNCQWEPFQSLAVCSTCTNLQEWVERSHRDNDFPWWTELKGIKGHNRSGITQFALPNGLYIDNFDDQPLKEGISMRMISRSTSNPAETVAFQSNDQLLWATSFFNVSNADEGIWPDVPVPATECILYYCVNEHTPAVVNGTINETIVTNTTAMRSPESWDPEDKRMWSAQDPLTYDWQNSTINRTDVMFGDGFNISQAGIDGMNYYLQTTLGIVNDSYLYGYALKSAVIEYKPDAMQPLHQGGNLTATFAAIATSMTNAIRTGADEAADGPSRITGKNGVPITLYNVRWPWISLPAALIVAGFLFLFIGSQKSRRDHLPLWKSCSLATLSRGAYVQALDGLSTTSGMHVKAGDTYLRLLNRGDPGASSTSGLNIRGSTTPTTPISATANSEYTLPDMDFGESNWSNDAGTSLTSFSRREQ